MMDFKDHLRTTGGALKNWAVAQPRPYWQCCMHTERDEKIQERTRRKTEDSSRFRQVSAFPNPSLAED